MEGYALLIGVNEVDPCFYTENLKLNCVDADLREMTRLLNQVPEIKGRIKPFTSKNAKWTDIKKEIETYYSKLAESNDEDVYLVIYYTGHGKSWKNPDTNISEEFYSFYDEPVSEFKIRSLLLEFSSRYKIFIIADTCHGGGLSEWEESDTPDYPANTNHGHPKNIKTKIIPTSIFEKIIHKISFSDDKSPKHSFGHQETYSISSNNISRKPFLPNAEIAIFAACGKHQLTEQNMGPNEPSKFTSLITKKWKPSKSRNSFCLRNIVNSERPPYVKSQLNIFTNSNFFMTKKAFSSTDDAQCTCVRVGFLEEITGDLVKIYQPEEEEFEDYKHSHGSFTIDLTKEPERNSGRARDVIGLIKNNDNTYVTYEDKIEVLSVVFINDDNRGTPFDTVIYDMRSVDPCSTTKNGYVVLITTYGTWKFKKGQRTQGKVSNAIGG